MTADSGAKSDLASRDDANDEEAYDADDDDDDVDGEEEANVDDDVGGVGVGVGGEELLPPPIICKNLRLHAVLSVK